MLFLIKGFDLIAEKKAIWHALLYFLRLWVVVCLDKLINSIQSLSFSDFLLLLTHLQVFLENVFGGFLEKSNHFFN